MVNSPVISNLKIELGELALKDIILGHYMNGCEYNKDNYECYFYLTEDGSPQFVIEQKSS